MDPFAWDVEMVVQTLCGQPFKWAQGAALLTAKIRDEEIDGKLLLTLEDTLSRDELMTCLGIKKIREKSTLQEEIVRLRSSSSQYQAWYRDFTKKSTADDASDNSDYEMSNASQITMQVNGDSSRTSDTKKPLLDDTAHNKPRNNLDAEPRSKTQSADATFLETAVADVPHLSMTNETNTTEDRTSKRRRVAPINVSQQPFLTKPEYTHPWEHSTPGSYIGNGKILAQAIKSSGNQISTRVIDLGNDEFTIKGPNHLPPGRRLAVNRYTKQFLRKSGRQESQIRAGITPMRSPALSEDVDEILNLEDLPELDEETMKEMKEEEEDNERARLLDRRLTRDEIEAVIAETVEETIKNWEDKKLPKLERKAHHLWSAAVRRGKKWEQILKARQEVLRYDARIRDLTERILSEPWTNASDVKVQAQCLEQSVEDKSSSLWLIKTLELRQPPPKPHHLPPPPERRQKERAEDPREEILTSDDEEQDDFIVQDQPHTHYRSLPTDSSRDGNLVTPIKAEQPMVVDLTDSRTHARGNHRTVIDLTSPVKGQETRLLPEGLKPPEKFTEETQPSLEELDIEAIAAVDRKHWQKQNDRWRLTIYVLRNLTHHRRTAVFNMIMSNDHVELWELGIVLYTQEPFSTPEQLADAESGIENFDLTRTFYCFLACRNMSVSRFFPLKQSHVRKLKESEPVFAVFCKFVLSIIDLFPQDSQILDTAMLDQDLLDFDGDEPVQELDDASSPARKPRAAGKEIVQDLNAKSLRERETRRGQEQELRRAKLRETLAASASMSQDRTRLIINESKEENQSLIYVNQEIGGRIKDHQIQGVRFLWNQIIQDKGIRQGCLLAHTMGLGKTMQVITFLVAIAEASASPDPSTKSQIPEDLRSPRTLVLCPSSLVKNWMDEFLIWAPRGLLGNLSQLDASVDVGERKAIVQDWSTDGGVLIMGYKLFLNVQKIDKDVESMLTDQTVIVVADEAHKLKNPDIQLSKACSKFITNTRIALTGSPLANNVEEYYAMIDWVAPNFLGPLAEFRNIYVHDIEAGFYKDSNGFEKRRALVRLQALKATVAPKVNRATIQSCQSADLPPKSEYVISMVPTALQRELYNMYIEALGGGVGEIHQAFIFSTVSNLSLICNHPRCFNEKVSEIKKDLEAEKNLEAKKGLRVDGDSGSWKSFPKSLIGPGLRLTSGTDKSQPSLSLKVEFLTLILDEARRVKDKVIVFSHSLHTLDYLTNLLNLQRRKVWRLDGKSKMQNRQDETKGFNKGNIEVALISTTAGGEGLNIQGANRVVMFDSRWNPMAAQQAVGRAYRIGQQKKVSVYHFVLSGTFEEDMHNKAVFKTQMAQRVVDKKNPVSWSKRNAKLIHPVEDRPKKDLSDLAGKDHILDQLIAFRANASPGQLISSIVTTDTFEEEDPDIALTEREKQEADNMVSMNWLRRTDPREYERMKGETNQQAAGNPNLYMPHAPTVAQTSSAPFSSAPSSSAPTWPTGAFANMLVSLNTVPSLPNTVASTQGPLGTPVTTSSNSANGARGSVQHHPSNGRLPHNGQIPGLGSIRQQPLFEPPRFEPPRFQPQAAQDHQKAVSNVKL